jgi:hypothetical protein
MLKDDVKQVIDIARMVAKEEIALALKVLGTPASVKPEVAPVKKEEKKNG